MATFVIGFKVNGRTHRAVFRNGEAPEVAVEIFDGRDALGGERWLVAHLDDVDKYGNAVVDTHDWISAIVKAAAADPSPESPVEPTLPDGWTWKEWSNPSIHAAVSAGRGVWIDSGHLELEEGQDRAPLAVVEAVIARHRAGKAGA